MADPIPYTPPPCKICGAQLRLNTRGAVGDPVWVCLTDDQAHADAAAARAAQLVAALGTVESDVKWDEELERLAQLGARDRPR
jgi:hypothetical protein